MIFGFKTEPAKQKQQVPQESLASRLRRGLQRTHTTLLDGLVELLPAKKSIDNEFMETLEERLLMADLGVAATTKIIDQLPGRLKHSESQDTTKLTVALHDLMCEILQPVEQPLVIAKPVSNPPFVILVVGVNGAGKTTSIGKLAKHIMADGHSVMLAAGDTFRAAAVEQITAWGERNQVPVIAQKTGADAAAVIYDALQSARAHHVDVVIADTAGRLHTQASLMDELRKVRRTITRFDENIAVECMLVVDAGAGQNVLAQTRQFNDAIEVTGITLTKLDGTAKGGIIFALAQEMQIPVRYIGVGEQIDDLQTFHADTFVNALLSD